MVAQEKDDCGSRNEIKAMRWRGQAIQARDIRGNVRLDWLHAHGAVGVGEARWEFELYGMTCSG